MKKLIILSLAFISWDSKIFAQCECVQSAHDSSGQMTRSSSGTTFIRLDSIKWLDPLTTEWVLKHSPVVTGKAVQRSEVYRLDTIREIMLVTTRPMGMARSVKGYTVLKNDSCIAHLDCRKRLIKYPAKVWICEHKKRTKYGAK